MKKLTKVERFLLENQGDKYNSYRCAEHGVFQTPKSKGEQSACAYSNCQAAIEVIPDPQAYLAAN